MTDVRTDRSAADERPPWVALFGDDAPDALASPYEVARRRRKLLGLSMLLIVPIGIFAIGVMINVVLVAAAANAYAQKDYLGSASWSRASVSLNPIDTFLPHYNLGTAYTKAGLLDDGRKELTTAVQNAPTPEAQCPARANLALTYEQLGDRSTKNGDTDKAAKQYLTAAALWQRVDGDVCFQNQQFSDADDAAIERLRDKLPQQDQSQQGQDGQQGQDQDGQGQQGQDQGDGQQPQDGSGDGDQQGGGQGDQQGQDQQGGGQGDQQGQGQGGSGDQQGQGQQGQGDQQGQGGSGTSDDGSGGIGETKDSSRSLGDKLGELKSRDEQSTRARDQGDRSRGGSVPKPW